MKLCPLCGIKRMRPRQKRCDTCGRWLNMSLPQGVTLEQVERLRRATEDEGHRLAVLVRDGWMPRLALERALERTGDAEPRIALMLLDEWEAWEA